MHFIFVFALYAALLYDVVSGRTCEGCADRSFAERYTKLMPRDELCSTSYRYRWWCPATQLPTRAIVQPTELSSYVGLSALVLKGEHPREALFDRAGLSVLHLGPEGAAMDHISLPEPSSASRADWETAYKTATAALSYRRYAVLVPPTLEAAILAARVRRPLAPVTYADLDARWTAERPARMWVSEDKAWGSAIVVVEEREHAWVVSIYPKRPVTAEPLPSMASAAAPVQWLKSEHLELELIGGDRSITLPDESTVR